MRSGVRPGLPSDFFDMVRTDLAGLAMLAAVVVFALILYLGLKD